MIAVIIAGGSGSRLWPLSTPDFPKHLLKIGDEDESLLQKTYDRVSNVASRTFIITEKSHAEHVRMQLYNANDKDILVEPGRRGTMNCVLLALSRIEKECSKDEPILILWADHYIRDIHGFGHSISVAARIAKEEKRLVLVGVEPTHPATGFGYIQKGEQLNDYDYVFSVKSFKEKPQFSVAEKYIKSGSYLWNSGYIVGTANVLLDNLKSYSQSTYNSYVQIRKTSNSDLDNMYLNLPVSNLEAALTEKVTNLLVVPAAFDWMDLGSYKDLHQATGTDEQGNYVYGENVKISDVENSFIQNQEDKPIAVIGLDNVVVVNTKDGILVARKDLSQEVGQISKEFQNKE